MYRRITSSQISDQLYLWEMVQVAAALLTSATPIPGCYTTASQGGPPDLVQQSQYIMYRCICESMLCLFEPHWVCQLFEEEPLLSNTTEKNVRRLSCNTGEFWALTGAAYAGDESYIKHRLQVLKSNGDHTRTETDPFAVSAVNNPLRVDVFAHFEYEEQNHNRGEVYASSPDEWTGLEDISLLWRILAIPGNHEEDNLNPLSATFFIALKRGNIVLVSTLLDDFPELLTEPFISHKFGAEGFLEAALAARTDSSLFMLLSRGVKVPTKYRNREMLFKCIRKSIDDASHHIGPQRFYTLKRVIDQWGTWRIADFKNHLLHRAALRNDIDLAEFVFEELGDRAKISRYESPDWSVATDEKTDYLYAAVKSGRIDYLKFVLEKAASFHRGKTRCFYSCDFCTMRRACVTDMIGGVLPMDCAIFELILSNSQDTDLSAIFRHAAETLEPALLNVFARNINLNAYAAPDSKKNGGSDLRVGPYGLRGAIKKLRVDNVKLLMREYDVEMPYQCTLPRISKKDGEQMENFRELKAFLKLYEIKADVEVQYVVTFKRKTKPTADAKGDNSKEATDQFWDLGETSTDGTGLTTRDEKEINRQSFVIGGWDDWASWRSKTALENKTDDDEIFR